MDEFNRVLGGGVVPRRSLVLIGNPGIGKSTLLLRSVNAQLANKGYGPLYLERRICRANQIAGTFR